MKSKMIALGDIKYDHRIRSLGDLEKLAESISRHGLQQAVVLSNDGRTLVSGLRRLRACQALGMENITALIPSDVIEAAEALQREIKKADPETDFPMTLRERMELAHQLHSMPAPSAGVSHSVYASDVVGISNRTYWRIRAVMNLAREDDPNPPFSAIRARKIVPLMLAAVENPPAGWPPSRIIEELHKLRTQGDIPESLNSFPPPRKASKADRFQDHIQQTPTEVAVSPPAVHLPKGRGLAPETPRRAPEVSRVVASLAGVCAGISSITEIKTSCEEDLAHWDSELKTCKRIINGLHGLVRKANNA
ncbi:ParB N-terminal domain-containing protein [Streptomyces parvulus]|uniref:ParB N-terminal domain-containing protein n=1 Tax=Streptomyces parvulus TaxID=146923 RepID=UPI0033FC05F9